MKATKYPEVTELPQGAMRVSHYARENGYAHNYIYVKYDRSLKGKATVDFKIVQFQGGNFVVKDTN